MAAGGAAAVCLRPACAADAPALARLFAASRRVAMPWLPVLWTAEQDLAWMAGEVLPGCRVTVAEAGGAVIGFAARRGAWIEHLYLDPGRLRRGLGAALLAAAAGDDEPPVLRLHAFKRNTAARAFYERQGFRAVAESDGSDNEEKEPSVLFERRVQQDGTPAGETQMSQINQPEVRKGLVGVYADTSSVSKVMPETNSLTYRGYAVQDLCEECSFEEVAYLLWHGELPNAAQLAEFKQAEAAERPISENLHRVLAAFPPDAHPMDAIRTAVSFLGMEDPEAADVSEPAQRRKAMRLFAKIPTCIAAAHRAAKGQEPVAPNPDHSFAENLFHLVQGKVPQPEVVKSFDVSLILYAEHTFNASTFTARTVTSTGADIHGAITAAIAALKGPLHGGANEAVMHMLKEVGGPEKAAEWLRGKFDHKALVMGFGHRVYKSGDSRVPTMTKYAEKMAEVVGDRRWMETSRILAAEMLKAKNIHPNLDFPTGPAYYLMGWEIPLFTPIFVASRITGWAAHVFEQAEDNRLIRPLSAYTGLEQRPVPPISSRR